MQVFSTGILGSQESSSAKDLFSAQSKDYASSRPTYPRALFEFIVGLVDEKNLAWDCATGNGQAALVLTDYFKQVIASDISASQLEIARQESISNIKSFAQKTHRLKTIA
jgi:methylase of polypeptide subunit release factors